MDNALHFSTFAAIHGPQPCDECGGPTNYWVIGERRHLCVPCARDADIPPSQEAARKILVADVTSHMREAP